MFAMVKLKLSKCGWSLGVAKSLRKLGIQHTTVCMVRTIASTVKEYLILMTKISQSTVYFIRNFFCLVEKIGKQKS